MRDATATIELWLAVVLGLLGCFPTLLYVVLIARAPQLEAKETRQLLVDHQAQAVFLEPLEEQKSPFFEGKTTELRRIDPTKKTQLFCRNGIESALLAQKLRHKNTSQFLSVHGGMQEWIASMGGLRKNAIRPLNGLPNQDLLHFSRTSFLEQVLPLIAFFGIKTLYTGLAAFGIFLLWRRAEPELLPLNRALFAFIVGETCCFVNVIFFAERSVVFEHIHGLFMAISIGFSCFGLLVWLERCAISNARSRFCALNSLCGTCTLSSTCRLRRLSQLLVPMLASLTLIPLTAEYQSGATTTVILGRLHSYAHPVIHQWFELRYLPLVAFGLFLACEFSLLRKTRIHSRVTPILFSAAVGAFGFSCLRLSLVAPFSTRLVWFTTWEEFTELLYICGILAVLWVFRDATYDRKVDSQ
jgi:hypothetical protein